MTGGQRGGGGEPDRTTARPGQLYLWPGSCLGHESGGYLFHPELVRGRVGLRNWRWQCEGRRNDPPRWMMDGLGPRRRVGSHLARGFCALSRCSPSRSLARGCIGASLRVGAIPYKAEKGRADSMQTEPARRRGGSLIHCLGLGGVVGVFLGEGASDLLSGEGIPVHGDQ